VILLIVRRFVMPGLDPGIHVFAPTKMILRLPGLHPAITKSMLLALPKLGKRNAQCQADGGWDEAFADAVKAEADEPPLPDFMIEEWDEVEWDW
jgi:hypothetical protein